MPFFLAGVAVLLLLVIGGRVVAGADPRKMAALLRKAGGVVVLVVAALLLTRGVVVFAIPLGLFGLALIGLPVGHWFGYGGGSGGGARQTPGQRSRVQTEALEMELDHDSGRMEGRCRSGKFAARTLSSLDQTDLVALLDELRVTDAQGALLIEAYLDRRFPDWREACSRDTGREEPRGPARSRMSVKEAYDVLGLREGASEQEIRAAHRKLMLKLHPDQGGSTYLAARINEAKDVLLRGK
jgi:hypothetical protein